MKTLKLIPLALLALLSFNSCSNDDSSQPVNEEELITTVIVTLTPEDGSQPVILTSRDLDGDGPSLPTFSNSGTISALKTYYGTVAVLNELSNPVEDISIEIAEEGTEHQFFFKAVDGLSGSFEYTDEDQNGNPIGLKFKFTPSANTQSGLLNVILKHNPNKWGKNVSIGDLTNAGGATDLEISFPVFAE